ncbi:MAG TPA: GNAT family protein [Actinomycetota bacterium]|jgi:RimJ/RimL family protein N-acetyltransferase|nr:GNAT family protein [Actinomycetota bacterium]
MKITTPRLTLKPATVDLAPLVWRAVEVSLVELSPWMAWARDVTPEAQEEWIRGLDAAGERAFIVFDGEEVAGTVGLGRVEPCIRAASIGYWTRSDAAGRGYATEAVAAVVEHAFAELGLHRLELRAGVDNHGSNRVARKLGFRLEGVARHGCCGAYGHYDANVYGLLADDPRLAP